MQVWLGQRGRACIGRTFGVIGRKQRVVTNGTFSSWEYVKSGVPQGSALGPVPFLLCVNDMPRVVRSSSIAMFGDDTKCFNRRVRRGWVHPSPPPRPHLTKKFR